jgi:hypothetical protein
MTAARKLGFAASLCLAGVLGSGSPPSAIAANLTAAAVLGSAAETGIVAVSDTRRHHRRRAVGGSIYPQAGRDAPGCPGLRSWNPNNPDRGYCDPGFAYHGNVNGCAVDLGYGRWQSCDSLGGGAGGGLGR